MLESVTNIEIIRSTCLIKPLKSTGLALDHMKSHVYYSDGSSTIHRVGWDDGDNYAAMANPFMGSFGTYMEIDPIGRTLYV